MSKYLLNEQFKNNLKRLDIEFKRKRSYVLINQKNINMGNLKNKISYEEALKFMKDLYEQIEEMEYDNYYYRFLNLEDILWIDGRYLIINYINIQKTENDIIQIENDNSINYNVVAPELRCSSFPIQMNVNKIYYNIALLTLELMENTFEEIQNTKLYYLLYKCMYYSKFIYI